jgi:teichuronic acid biosynthesis glycosyltransferase TuaC
MRVLHIVSSWPTARRPFVKPFITSQIDSLRRAGVSVDVMNLNATKNTFNYLLGMLRIIDRSSRQKYDLIHAHYSYCGWSAKPQHKVPVILSLMGSDLYGIANQRGGQTPAGFFNVYSTKILVRLMDAVIVKSARMREMVDATRVHVIPNGVDFTRFKPVSLRASLSADSLEKRILFLGNPRLRRKNFPLAFRAVEIVKKKYPGARLESAFGVDQNKVVELMNSSHLLLLTSLQEGSPNVVKEAMACNLPIVSTDVGDVSEVIGGTEGCYTTTFAPQDVAEKVIKVLERGRRTNGRDMIRHLEINTVARRIIGVYESVLGRN